MCPPPVGSTTAPSRHRRAGRSAPVLVAVAAAAASLGVGATARAQHEHHAMGAGHHHGHAAPPPFTAALTTETANVVGGAYAGAGVRLGARWRRVAAEVALSFYHLELLGLTFDGVGDVTGQLGATLVARPRWNAGAMVMASLPTGDRYALLGMGHVMVMPMAWLGVTGGAVDVTASLTYGRALGIEAGHVHQPPVVAPMNQEEVAGALRAERRLARRLRAALEVTAATPIGAGDDRIAVGVGARWSARRRDAGFTVQLPVTGEPFRIRAVLDVAVHF